ncbi:uncharacterized protein (DUF983 family) [Azospirillum agricola]|uniref:DUF983 domain-containing protein n=1 Tax=Azospirillum agricola TaxID=1720247 RepID=UPI0022777792|nr:DUF983 domain-containing protein [Azospirillum agricola]MBP2229616.1 uncharacterized protein (DUF983 family) [Azospirillum agricola]
MIDRPASDHPPISPLPAARPLPSLPPMETGIRGRCPRCGQGHLFQGYLTLAPRCAVCGLDFSFADPADGPAFFVMSIVSFPVVAFAGWLEVSFGPPLWVHVLTSLPLLLIGCLGLLRPLKGWIVCAQYVHKAAEARLAEPQAAPPADACISGCSPVK